MTLTDTSRHVTTSSGRLAHLIADPGERPFYLDAENHRDGWAGSIAEAVDSGRTFVVYVARDVLAIDVDTAAQVAALDRLAGDLDAAGWPVLRVASGRPDHRHLWAVVPDAAARTAFRARAGVLGLPAPRDTMRPPCSPHRLGLPVEALDDPVTFVAEVEAVRARTGALRRSWRDVLRTGRHRGADQSPSAAVWHVCVGAIRDGLSLDEVRALLDDPVNVAGAAYRRRVAHRGQIAADRWLTEHVWPSAERAAARLPPSDADDARERLRDLARIIEAQRWRGVAGATDRAVLLALVGCGLRRGSMSPEMSYRQIAEAAPCSLRTVQTSVARLRAAGWLLVAERGCGVTSADVDGSLMEVGRSTRWRFAVPESARTCHTGGTPPAGTSLSVATSRALLDVGRWGGLGLNAARILAVLSDGPVTVRDIAVRLGLSISHLRARLLPRLASHGLIVRTSTGWQVTDDLDDALVRCAERLNLAGKADAVAAEHRKHREQYLDYRERTRPLRSIHRRRRIWSYLSGRRSHLDAAHVSSRNVTPSLPLVEVECVA